MILHFRRSGAKWQYIDWYNVLCSPLHDHARGYRPTVLGCFRQDPLNGHMGIYYDIVGRHFGHKGRAAS